ncbi:MAG: hypothetical protein AAB221_11955 [Bacteroidota bacterium]
MSVFSLQHSSHSFSTTTALLLRAVVIHFIQAIPLTTTQYCRGNRMDYCRIPPAVV